MTKPPSARAPWALPLLLGALAGCERGAPVQGAGSGGPRTDVAPDDSADFGPLPDFRLLDAHGNEVTLAALLGRPLVLGALFSTCTGPCPSLARGLKELQDRLAETDALIVVVSVDPATDTPEVLAHYAERVGARPERWIFLTGAEAEAHELVRTGFFLAVERGGEELPPGQRVTHDVRLLAVDRRGHRRGWYTGTDENQLEKLRRRMLHLAAEPR